MSDIMQAQAIIDTLSSAYERLDTLTTTVWNQEHLDTIPIDRDNGWGALSSISNAISYIEEQIQNVINERESREGDQ